MEQSLLVSCYLFVLAAFLGHTSFIACRRYCTRPDGGHQRDRRRIASRIAGAAGAAGGDWTTLTTILGTIAVFCASINAIGGFMITDRMLKMFRKKPASKAKGH